MKKAFVIGTTGQIGSELVAKLRSMYGAYQVVAGYVPGVKISEDLLHGGLWKLLIF